MNLEFGKIHPRKDIKYIDGATIKIQSSDEYLSMDMKNINFGSKSTRTPNGTIGTNNMEFIDTKNLSTDILAPVITKEPVIPKQEPVNPNVTEPAEDDDACCPENMTKGQLIMEILTWTMAIVMCPVWLLCACMANSAAKAKKKRRR